MEEKEAKALQNDIIQKKKMKMHVDPLVDMEDKIPFKDLDTVSIPRDLLF